MRERHLRRLVHHASHGGATVANRLRHWQRQLFYATGALLVVTGGVWLVVHYARAADALPSPAESWLMRAHGLGAFAALFVLGALAAAHVPRGWRLVERLGWQAQRRTGLVLCVFAGTLALTGYLLYYFAADDLRPALGWMHSALGAAMAILVAAHRRGGERA